MDNLISENIDFNARNNITVGRIISIDNGLRNFSVISDGNLSTLTRFNLSPNARIFDFFGRPVSFSRLVPGLRVRVRHASFMTPSIPPQTTAFEVRMVR